MTRRLLSVGATALLLGAYTIPRPDTPLSFGVAQGRVAVSGEGFSAVALSATLDPDRQKLRLFGIDGDPARLTLRPLNVEVGRIISGQVVAVDLKAGSITVEKE